MKRILILVMAFALSTVFFGCQKKAASTTAPADEGKQVVEQPAATPEAAKPEVVAPADNTTDAKQTPATEKKAAE